MKAIRILSNITFFGIIPVALGFLIEAITGLHIVPSALIALVGVWAFFWFRASRQARKE